MVTALWICCYPKLDLLGNITLHVRLYFMLILQVQKDLSSQPNVLGLLSNIAEEDHS